MIANIWGEGRQLEETVSTLKFASRMMRVSSNAILNVVHDPKAMLRQYEKQIRELKQELEMHDQLKGHSALIYDEYTEEQRLDLRNTIRRFVNDEIEELEIKNLRHVREILGQFKIVYKNSTLETEEKMSKKFNISDKENDDDNGFGKTNSSGKLEQGVGDDNADGFGEGRAIPNSKFKAKVSTPSLANTRMSERDMRQSMGTTGHIGEENEIGVMPLRKAVSKNDAYEEFKQTIAVEAVTKLRDGSTMLREKRNILRDLTRSINGIKTLIDEIKQKIESKKQCSSDLKGRASESDVVDEEENLLYQHLKEIKVQYRDKYDERRTIKSEYDYVSKTIDTIRKRLLSEFEMWYSENYGDIHEGRKDHQILDAKQQELDRLDDDEKFELLELERLQREDPESMTYFRAKRRTDTNKALTKMKRTFR